MNTKFDRILFDLDGTIVIHNREKQGFQIADILGLPENRRTSFAKRLDSFFSHPYYAIEKKMTYEMYLDIMRKTIRSLEIYGIEETEVLEAIEANVKLNSKLAEDIMSTLEYLQDKGYKLCIYTNGFYDFQMRVLSHFKLLDYFERIFTWDNFYTKSDKRAVLRALDGTDPKANVMIGDSLFDDMMTQKDVGMYTIGYKIPVEKQYSKIIDVNISSYKELRDIL